MPGVISAGGPETAAAGAAMLRQGGNAVDAAVAAAFVSFIAEIGVVHLGGSGLAHLYDARAGVSLVYDFFSAMPGLGRDGLPEALDFGPVTIDFGATTQEFHLGRGAVAVPGNVFGLCRLAAEYGRLPLTTLLAPALALARDGVALTPFQAATCALLAPLYTHTESMRRIFVGPHGRLLAAGERLFIPDLARTLSWLGDEGERLLRAGHLAQTLLDDQAAHGGLMTATDLATYEVRVSPSITLSYRDFELLLPPPSSTGGVLIAFTLRVLADFDVAGRRRGGADQLQLLFEALAATDAARPTWQKMWHAAGEGRAGFETAVDHFLADAHVGGYRDRVAHALAGQRAPAPPATRRPGNTSHLSVVDDAGLAVSLTTTAGESAGFVVPGTGFIPNNILGEADLNPDGFHRWPAGARIGTMMSPMIVSRDGQVRLVVGSGGSERIRSAIVQVLLNVLDYELPLDEAVNAPRVHVEGGVLQCEAGYDEAAVAELERRGYRINRWASRSIYFGGAHSVARAPDGRLIAAGDNRRGGSTAVVG